MFIKLYISSEILHHLPPSPVFYGLAIAIGSQYFNGQSVV